MWQSPTLASLFCRATSAVVLFGKDWSPYSFKGKKALGTLLKPDEWVLISINGRPDMSPIQDVLLTMTGARTVPRVFVCGACIGGGNETKAMAESGELKKLLIEKGVLAA